MCVSVSVEEEEGGVSWLDEKGPAPSSVTTSARPLGCPQRGVPQERCCAAPTSLPRRSRLCPPHLLLYRLSKGSVLEFFLDPH